MNCPKDLNSFLLGEPLFENTFPNNECEEKKFYGDCFHCFATSICKRDKQLINSVLDEIRAEIYTIDINYYKSVNGVDMTECAEDIKEDILKIIDKYRKEKK